MRPFIGYVSAAFLIGIGLLFAWAGSVRLAATRIPIGLFMVLAGVGIIYMVRRRVPREVVQKVDVSGRMVAQEVLCPHCSASLNLGTMVVVGGVPTIKCTYCDNSFEVTEEPKW